MWSKTGKISIEEAKRLQKELARKVRCLPLYKEISLIAGVDVSIRGGMGVACVVVMDYPYLREVDVSIIRRRIDFPYIPGFLSFREGPIIMEAIKELSITPDVFMFDGQGIAHPRGIGIASHMGVLMDAPAIGCAKSVLCGNFEEPAVERGSWTPLIYHEKVVGAVLRTRTGVRPVFVSVGHKIDLPACIKLVLESCKKYRIPEPIRHAHIIAGKEMKKLQ